MRVRDRVGLNFPPLILRFMLGAIFLWAGLGKLMTTFPVQGQDAADLAKMGVVGTPVAPAPKVEEKPKTGASRTDSSSRIVLASQQTPAKPEPKKAEDFSTPTNVRGLHQLSLMILHVAHPGADDKGAAKMPLWPEALAKESWPVYFAWAAALAETLAGAGLLVGFLTRFWGLTVAGVMAVALWLTQFGPAIQSGNTMLGFLPAHPTFSPDWIHLFFPFAMLCSGLAILFLGPGRLSLDYALFAPAREDDDEDAE